MINKVILLGNCGNDPEIINTQGGKKIANVSLATSETFKDAQGQKQTSTTWHKLVFFNKLAEVVENYVKKGSKLYIEGSIRVRDYEDKQGVKRYINEINVNTMQMLDSKKSEEF